MDRCEQDQDGDGPQAIAHVARLDRTQGEERRELIADEGEEAWRMAFSRLRQLRFARLCAFLRWRQPDADIGGSILICRLSDADVEQATTGKPAELLPERVPLTRNASLVN